MPKHLAAWLALGLCLASRSLAQSALDPLGATPHDGFTRFRLWARGATAVQVSVRGRADVAMTAQGDDVWATDVPGARAGDPYTYAVTRGADTVVEADPASRVLAHAQSGIVQGWPTPPAFTAPDVNHLVIYELHIGSFAPDASGAYTFAGAESRLPYLKDLGVNAVELMPVNENFKRPDNAPLDFNWGYDPVHFNAVERTYGTPQQLVHLVQACHASGLAVILDVVYNHVYRENAFDPSWFGATVTPWGPRPDFTDAHVRKAIFDNALGWLRDYGMDGLRWDSVINIRHFPGAGNDADGAAMLRQFNTQVNPGKIMIAEDLQESPEVTSPSGLDFNAQWDDGLWWTLKSALVQPPTEHALQRIADQLKASGDVLNRVFYSEDHDKVGHPADHQVRFPALVSPDDPQGLDARERSTLAGAVVLTAPGIPMLFQGQETLDPRTFEFHQRVAVDWSRVRRYRGVVQMYRDLIRLRRQLPGLSGGDSTPFHVDDPVLAWLRATHGHNDGVVVVANFSPSRQVGVRIGVPSQGPWRVRFNSAAHRYDAHYAGRDGNAVSVHAQPADGYDHNAEVTLEPYSLVLLSQ